jgi:hypothetical protein
MKWEPMGRVEPVGLLIDRRARCNCFGVVSAGLLPGSPTPWSGANIVFGDASGMDHQAGQAAGKKSLNFGADLMAMLVDEEVVTAELTRAEGAAAQFLPPREVCGVHQAVRRAAEGEQRTTAAAVSFVAVVLGKLEVGSQPGQHHCQKLGAVEHLGWRATRAAQPVDQAGIAQSAEVFGSAVFSVQVHRATARHHQARWWPRCPVFEPAGHFECQHRMGLVVSQCFDLFADSINQRSEGGGKRLPEQALAAWQDHRAHLDEWPQQPRPLGEQGATAACVMKAEQRGEGPRCRYR